MTEQHAELHDVFYSIGGGSEFMNHIGSQSSETFAPESLTLPVTGSAVHLKPEPIALSQSVPVLPFPPPNVDALPPPPTVAAPMPDLVSPIPWPDPALLSPPSLPLDAVPAVPALPSPFPPPPAPSPVELSPPFTPIPASPTAPPPIIVTWYKRLWNILNMDVRDVWKMLKGRL